MTTRKPRPGSIPKAMINPGGVIRRGEAWGENCSCGTWIQGGKAGMAAHQATVHPEENSRAADSS